ncbi:MAG: GlyGly-CTERM sorting domain-containing protein [Bacteroidales bacterium]|nr:GlyGly-CTERM sorting domain-containing protein [Bacteroidales bacterium]
MGLFSLLLLIVCHLRKRIVLTR